MKYLTILLRYENDVEIKLPDFDDVVLGGEVTSVSRYDVPRVANIAVNALGDNAEVIDQIDQIISKG